MGSDMRCEDQPAGDSGRAGQGSMGAGTERLLPPPTGHLAGLPQALWGAGFLPGLFLKRDFFVSERDSRKKPEPPLGTSCRAADSHRGHPGRADLRVFKPDLFDHGYVATVALHAVGAEGHSGV